MITNCAKPHYSNARKPWVPPNMGALEHQFFELDSVNTPKGHYRAVRTSHSENSRGSKAYGRSQSMTSQHEKVLEHYGMDQTLPGEVLDPEKIGSPPGDLWSTPNSEARRSEARSSANLAEHFQDDSEPTSQRYSEDDWRVRLHRLLEEPSSGNMAKVVSFTVLLLVGLSVLSLLLESVPSAVRDIDSAVWIVIEYVSSLVFTVEYLLRFLVCDVFGTTTKCHWVLQASNICDLMAILPFYLELALSGSKVSGLRVLRSIRLVRVFRVFKFGRYSSGMQVMAEAVLNSVNALQVLVFVLGIGLVLFAAAIYNAEKLYCPDFAPGNLAGFLQYNSDCFDGAYNGVVSIDDYPCCSYSCNGISDEAISLELGVNLTAAHQLVTEKFARGTVCELRDQRVHEGSAEGEWSVMALYAFAFRSIPSALWWAIATMTTVGYGEVVPSTAAGKLVAATAMVCGILVLTLPVAIMGSKFHEAYTKERDRAEAIARMEKKLQRGKTRAEFDQMQQARMERRAVAGFLCSDGHPAPHEEVEKELRLLKLALEESAAYQRELTGVLKEQQRTRRKIESELAQLSLEALAHTRDYNLLRGKKAWEEPVPEFCAVSLYLFDLDSPLRKKCIWLSKWVWFDRFILFLIVANSTLLALTDYWDKDSWKNKLGEETEIYFALLFTGECIVKVIVMGFCLDPNSYLRDTWNWLDFTVVVSGLLTLGGGGGGLSFLRTFRVLRPLRSLSAMPGLRCLVNTVFLALPRLSDVAAMAVFLLLIFGILGLNFWGGVMHRRCRVTPLPLHFVPPTTSLSSCQGLCFDDHTEVKLPSGALVNSSLPFNFFCAANPLCLEAIQRGEDYWLWPIDPGQDRMCGGRYECLAPDTSAWEWSEDLTEELQKQFLAPLGVPSAWDNSTGLTVDESYCGSALSQDESYGPAAVAGEQLEGVQLNDYWDEIDIESFNYGITHYDHIGAAFLVIFQSITLEGWVDIMHMLQDCHSDGFASLYFFILIVLCSFFLLNTALAIIWDAFTEIEEGRKRDSEANEEDGDFSDDEEDDDGDEEHHDGKRDSMGEAGSDNLWVLTHARRSQSQLSEVDLMTTMKKKRCLCILAKKITNSTPFQNFVMFIIVFNVVVLALDSYPPPGKSLQDFLNFMTVSFNIIFIVEFVLMHLALGIRKYWTDYVTAFDGIIVISSIVELIADSDDGALSALRGFRLLRIFKLAKQWPSFRVLLKSMVQTVLGMVNFCLLLILMIFVFTLMGQSFFAAKFLFDDSGQPLTKEKVLEECKGNMDCVKTFVPRAHFDTFLWGFITIFQILTGENWNAVMYYGIKAVGWYASFYFVFVVVAGNFVILNLFLAILMGNFGEQSAKLQEEEKSQKKLAKLVEETKLCSFSTDGFNTDGTKGGQSSKRGGLMVKLASKKSEQDQNGNVLTRIKRKVTNIDFSKSATSQLPNNPLKLQCKQLVEHKRFDQVILVFIFISSVLMSCTTPLEDPGNTMSIFLFWCNVVFTVVFSFEMLTKMIAMGLICGKKTYLRNSWNILDCVVVLISWLDFLPGTGGSVSSLRTFRLLRALRPLRLISRYENLKIVVNTLFKSLPELGSILVVGAMFYLIFGLLGVSYFKGSFYGCVDSGLEDVDFVDSFSIPGPATSPLCLGPREGSGPWFPRFCAEGPNEDEEVWRRPTSDTPICYLHCDSSEDAPAFCRRDASATAVVEPWGFHVLRCSECAAQFCSISEEDREGCRGECLVHSLFCTEERTEDCLQECIAQCMCDNSRHSHFCRGLAYDAALCVEQGGRWVGHSQHFDNILAAMQSLFEIATTEGWVDMMYKGVDAVGPMRAPRRDNVEIWSLFFVAFIVVGCFFVLNLCVGVIIDNYNKMKMDGKTIIMTPAQQQWVASQKALFRRKHFFPLTNLHEMSTCTRRLYLFVTDSNFENTIMGAIILNTVTMAIAIHPPPSREYQQSQQVLNYVFAMVFNVEAILKFAAMGRRYFTEKWNVFDFACVLATNFSIIINEFTNVKLGTVVSAIRIFRIARLLRLLRFLKGLNQLFTAFMLSIPKLFNVGAILCLLIYLYAVLGMNLFAKVIAYDLHGPHANFRTFYRSIMTLVRSFTGEAWNDLMHSLAKDRFFFESVIGTPCLDNMEITAENYAELKQMGRIDDPIECGNVLAYPFFLTYTMLVTFVVLNLFIAVIIEGFNDSQNAMEEDHIALCLETWKGYDPDFSMFLPLDTTLLFISGVYCDITSNRPVFVPGLDEVGLPRGRTRAVDGTCQIEGLNLHRCPMKYAMKLDLQVTSDLRCHLSWVIAAVLRLVVCSNEGGTAAKDLDYLQERSDEYPEMVKIKALEKKHCNAFAFQVRTAETLEFKKLVATIRIQHQAREKLQWEKRKKDLNRQWQQRQFIQNHKLSHTLPTCKMSSLLQPQTPTGETVEPWQTVKPVEPQQSLPPPGDSHDSRSSQEQETVSQSLQRTSQTELPSKEEQELNEAERTIKEFEAEEQDWNKDVGKNRQERSSLKTFSSSDLHFFASA